MSCLLLETIRSYLNYYSSMCLELVAEAIWGDIKTHRHTVTGNRIAGLNVDVNPSLAICAV